jgi:rhodanese-related sulfurtransferase
MLKNYFQISVRQFTIHHPQEKAAATETAGLIMIMGNAPPGCAGWIRKIKSKRKSRRKIMFKIFFISMFLFGYASNFPQQEQEDTMTIAELKAKLQNDSDLVVLDVRTPEELEGSLGKIDGIINIPIQELENRIDELKQYKGKEIAVICRSGVRSQKGTMILNNNGFNAKNVVGGMLEYRRNGKNND